MKPVLSFLALSALVFTSCAPTYFYQPAENQPETSDVIYTRGVPALRTTVQGCEVVAELTSKGERDMNLNLYIRNNTDSTFTFFPQEVQAHGFNHINKRVPYRVFGAEEYIRWKNTRDALIAAGVIVATVATVVAIDRATDGGSGGSNSGSIEDVGNGVSAGIDFVYDLTWWMAWTIPAAIENNPPPPAYSPDFLLRTHTLYPGEAVQGIVKVRAATEYKNKILVEVPINGAYTKFVFDRAQRPR